MSELVTGGGVVETAAIRRRDDPWRQLLADRAGVFGLAVVAMLILMAILAGVIAPHDPNAIDVASKFMPPSDVHPLGTDQLGRDVLSRVVYGGRVALIVALAATLSGTAIGMVLGLLAGYGPRWLDNIMVFSFDTARCFPMVILALAVGPLFGAGIVTVILIIAATSIPYYARIVRTQVLAAKNADYVLSLQSSGASVGRIIFLHILPNIVGPILILASMDIPTVIIAEAGLSFLGVGVKPPTSSWGLILNDGFRFVQQTPWLVIAGSVPLVITTLGMTFLGEALRDAFDPKLGRGI